MEIRRDSSYLNQIMQLALDGQVKVITGIRRCGKSPKILSSDILTEFRGCSDEIRVHPLSFAEYFSAVDGDYVGGI